MPLKKIYTFLTAMLLCITLLCGCTSPESTSESDKIEILCSNFSLYDWAKNITSGAENVEVVLLLRNGVDIHSFQPSAEDIIKIKNADLFVYNGSSSEEFLTGIADNSQHTFQAVSALENELMENHHSHGGEDHSEHDEHIWLSVRNAVKICYALADEIIEADPENAVLYEDNANKYINELSKLDTEFTAVAENSMRKEFVLADRFPFVYLLQDLGLTCHSAFPGCSDETEASFSTILELSQKVKDLNLSYVITTDGYNNDIAASVIQTSGVENISILSLNSLQTITDDEINSGRTYISAMTENLETLRKTLN